MKVPFTSSVSVHSAGYRGFFRSSKSSYLDVPQYLDLIWPVCSILWQTSIRYWSQYMWIIHTYSLHPPKPIGQTLVGPYVQLKSLGNTGIKFTWKLFKQSREIFVWGVAYLYMQTTIYRLSVWVVLLLAYRYYESDNRSYESHSRSKPSINRSYESHLLRLFWCTPPHRRRLYCDFATLHNGF